MTVRGLPTTIGGNLNRFSVYRYLVIIGVVCCFLFSTNAFGSDTRGRQVDAETMHTAYNIWLWPSHNMICLNYKGSRSKIPVGTPVKNIQIVDFRSDLFMGSDDDVAYERIQFTTVKPKKTYTIMFIPGYHPGKTIEDYREFMFTPKTFDELTVVFDPYETAAVKEGVITKGMRKDAVLASYGHPSERHTRGLDKNTWVYFIKKKERLKVHFIKNPTTGHEEVDQIDVLLGRRNRMGLTSYPRPVAAVPRPKPKPIAQPAPQTRPSDDIEYKLIKIKKLYEKGLINEEEYKKKRQQIMDSF